MSISKMIKTNFFVLFLSYVAFFSCTKKENSPVKEVNLAIWGNYITPDVQEAFEKKFGIKMNISNYSSNEELLAKVQSGASGLDVAVPSDYMVDIMIKTNLLDPITAAKISHKNLIYENLLNQTYDPGNKYSYPYAWSTAGIAINKTLYKKPIKGWKDFFNNADLAGKISLMDDVREVVAAALKLHGDSVNSTNDKELSDAKKSLLDVKSRIKMFRSDTVEALVNKEVAVAHAFSSDALQAAHKTNGEIEYVIPEEGGTRSIDNLVLVKGAPHNEAAHELINYLLSPEVNTKFVSHIFAGPVLKTTKASLPPEIQSNKALFPDASVLKKLEPIRDLGEKTISYDQLWTEVKSR
jgi:spermidine/putrescine transport system substrate-binding protein